MISYYIKHAFFPIAHVPAIIPLRATAGTRAGRLPTPDL